MVPGLIPKESATKALLLACGLAMPFVYFWNLPFNPGHAAQSLMDHFFGADCWRVLENLRDSGAAKHARDKVHPFFSLFAVSISKMANGFGAGAGEFLLYRSVFATLGAFFFWLIIYEETEDALLAFAATLVLLLSTTVRVWSALPETSTFGFFTLMLAFYLLRRKADTVPVFIVSLSGTITNAMVGLLYAWRRYRSIRPLLRRAPLVICILVMLTVLQKSLYSTSISMFEFWRFGQEHHYLNRTPIDIPFRVFDFLYSGFLIPWSVELTGPVFSDRMWFAFVDRFFSGYDSRIMYGVPLLIAAVTGLLAYAGHRYKKVGHQSELLTVLLLFLGFEFVMHLAYGDTPFLYSYQFLPVMLLFIALQLPRKLSASIVMIALAALLFWVDSAQRERFDLLFG